MQLPKKMVKHKLPKALAIKNATNIKGSIKKKIKRDLTSKYPKMEAYFNQLFHNKSDIKVAKLTGKDMNTNSQVYVYGDNPVFFKCWDILVPTSMMIDGC